MASILGIVLSIGAYAILSYSRAQALTAATNQLLTDMRDAQVRSQAEVRTYRVEFDLAQDQYVVSRLETDGPPPTYAVLETKRLASNVDLTVADFGVLDGATAYFFPRGTSSDGRVVIRSRTLDQDREIRLTGLTARAKVS